MKILTGNLILKGVFCKIHSLMYMKTHPKILFLFTIAFFLLFFSCKSKKQKDEEEILLPEEMNVAVQSAIKSMMGNANENGNINDSISVSFLPVLKNYYESNSYKPVWSNKEEWNVFTETLIQYLDTCERDGLFPEDFKASLLRKMHHQLTDSASKKIASTWANADILFTDAYFHIIQDLKQGRLQTDTLGWKVNREKQTTFFAASINELKQTNNLSTIFSNLQPTLKEYQSLRRCVPSFVDNMDRRTYTYLQYPYKDSLAFQKLFLKRLNESGFNIASKQPDSAMLSNVILKYQKTKKLKETGKVSASLISQLNNTDKEKFRRIAITLDRYKQLPSQLPSKYIWVNLPSYNLKVWNNDTLVMESRVIVGKPGTPTPFINSAISDIIVYPTWTIPNSIIIKEILPALKRNPGYLARKGYGLYKYRWRNQ